MPWIPLAIAAGSAIAGQVSSASDKDNAANARLAALQQFQNIIPPQESVNFDKYHSVGQYTPQLEQALQQDPSLMGQIQTNPQFSQASLGALNGLQGIANSGGLQTIDQANLNKLLGQAAQQNRGQQGAIQQQMAQRGMGGSGFQLAAQLSAQQNEANQANQSGTDVAAQAQMRALQALQGAGQMGQSLQGQQFNQKSQQAQAQDLINNFNTRNSQGVLNSNVGAMNAGAQYNLGNAQNLQNNNTDLANRQQLQNNQYGQQYFNDQLGLANARAGQYNTNSNASEKNASQTAGTWAGLGQAGNQIYAGYQADQAAQKTPAATNPAADDEKKVTDGGYSVMGNY